MPQLDGSLWLTDGARGEAALRQYFRTYAGIAERHGAGLVLERPTWRASAEWGRKLGYGDRDLLSANRRSGPKKGSDPFSAMHHKGGEKDEPRTARRFAAQPNGVRAP